MTDQPNIVVFLTDDHGQWALGCYGMRSLASPSIDWLARTGVRFDHAFTPTPVCSPARASFWTGKLASSHGIHDYIREPEFGNDHPGLRGQSNLAMCLRDAGYHTALVGKWHCNHPHTPAEGFDRWFTQADGTNARFGEQRFYDQTTIVEHHGHQAPPLTDQAVRFIRERPDDRPMFLFVGYTDTHTPHNAQPRRLVDHYLRHDFADVPLEPLTDSHGYVRGAQPRDDDARRAQLADYFASVTMIDEQVGRVIDELDSAGMLDDTLIVYTSDHGHMNGHHGLHCKGNATIPQNLLDESIHVPLVIRPPAASDAPAEPRTVGAFVDHCDLFQTLLDVAGAKCDDGEARPGASYATALTGDMPSGWRDAQFCEYGNARMIRTTTHKLIVRYPGPNGDWPNELYDLAADPREQRNVYDDPRHADAQAALTDRLEAHFAQYESARRTGRRIADQPACNDWQPWDVTGEEAERRRGR